MAKAADLSTTKGRERDLVTDYADFTDAEGSKTSFSSVRIPIRDIGAVSTVKNLVVQS